MLLLGVGAGLVFPALMTLAMSGATPEDSGLASGLVNTTQQVGGALGLAVLATLSTTRTSSLVAHGASNAAALTDGYHLAFTIAAALVLVAIAMGVVFLRPNAPTAAVDETSTPVAAEPEVGIPYLEEAA
jgi:MFS family permease